nr:hypothetical protein BSM_21890 [uncultured archaeon]
MKKEILAGLIAIVVIATIAIFVVNPARLTSVEIDGKRTSNELELLFLGSGDDDYQEYKYVSYKIEKNRISASAGGAEVYEAGFLPEFLEEWIDKLFEFLSGADPKELGEDLYEKVDEEYPHYDEAGEPGPTPVAGEATGEYAGPKKLIIDGELSEDEKNMLEAMGIGEIVYDESVCLDYGTGIRYVKSSHIAFLKKDDRYVLYLYEEVDPRMMHEKTNDLRNIRIYSPYSPDGFPKIIGNVKIGKCGFFEDEAALFKGLAKLDPSCIYPIRSAYSEYGCGMECVIKDIYPDIIKECVLNGGGGEILVDTAGGTARLNLGDIAIIEDVLVT